MVRKTLTLILTLLSAVAAQEYYISYTIISRDLVAVYDSLKISRAMTPLHGSPTPLCSFETDESTFESWAAKNRLELARCLLLHSASIRSYSRTERALPTKNLDILTTTILPVQVEFNDGLVTIKKIQ
ncbi:hypothetical protein [Hydrogenimonas sp.]